jgi:hypothetical protein
MGHIMRPMNQETSKLAADMVAQQIASYDQQLAQLHEQMRSTEARMEAVRMMRAALLPLLDTSPRDPAPEAKPPEEKNGSAPTLTPLSASNGSRATITGFADAVRAVLKDYPKGLYPSDVAEQMKVRGTDAIYTGKTVFTVRVGNELHRLMRSGELGRRAGRYYFADHESHQ